MPNENIRKTPFHKQSLINYYQRQRMNQFIAITAASGILGCILWFLQGIRSTDQQIRNERRARGKKDVGF